MDARLAPLARLNAIGAMFCASSNCVLFQRFTGSR